MLHQPRTDGADDEVSLDRLSFGKMEDKATGGLGLNALHRRMCFYTDAEGTYLRRQHIHESLKPASVVAKPRRAFVDARPEPGEVHLFVVGAKLPFQHGPPEHLVAALAHPPFQPRIRHDFVERVPRRPRVILE